MRDQKFDNIKFIEQLEKILSEVPQKQMELRMQVVDDPNFLAEYRLVLPFELRKLLELSLVSWYIPGELGWIIREEIRDQRLPKFSLEDKVLLELFLKSKESCILFLQETKLWHTRDFFGNFIKESIQVLQRLRFKKVSTKVNIPQRKRGYHDHGTLAPLSKWKPKEDFSLTELQNLIEENRKTQEDTLDFIYGLII